MSLGRAAFADLQAVSTPAEGEAFHRQYCSSWRFRLCLWIVLNRLTVTLFYPSIGTRYFTNGVSLFAFFEQRIKHVIREKSIARNPYLYPFVFGQYPDGCLPPYLQEAWYAEITQRIDRLQFVHGNVVDYLEQAPAASIDCFALSNVVDWMAPSEVDRLLLSVGRAGKSGARVVICSRGTTIADRIDSLVGLVEDRPMGRTLQCAERTGYYTFVGIYRVEKSG